jgi:hypothetical protein
MGIEPGDLPEKVSSRHAGEKPAGPEEGAVAGVGKDRGKSTAAAAVVGGDELA